MISFQEAKKRVEEQIFQQKERLPLSQALGRIAAEDTVAPIPVPPFDNSAMDGYAIRFQDADKGLNLQGEIPAGLSTLPTLLPGNALRIFTGAPLPPGADTVVPQEEVQLVEGRIRLLKSPNYGQHIRPIGSQTRQGDPILKAGTLLTAGYLGFLATFGLESLCVWRAPRIGVITTGSELQSPGQPLQPGQIYESNSVFLQAALASLGITPVFIQKIEDHPLVLKEFLQTTASQVDVILCTGGISVGDYDFVRPVLQELGTQELFYKVKQKPGKPLYVGKLDHTLIFALPGNPGAVATCFQAYVRPWIQGCMGLKKPAPILAKLKTSYTKKAGLTHLVKAHWDGKEVEILGSQLSYQMDAFVLANALVTLPEQKQEFKAGEELEILLF